MKNKRYAIVLDTHRCLDCKACTVACKAENDVPSGHKIIGTGSVQSLCAAAILISGRVFIRVSATSVQTRRATRSAPPAQQG